MRWKTICFDIDNTLFDYELAFQQGMIATCESQISDVNVEKWFKIFKQYCDDLWRYYESKEWTQQEYRYQRLYRSLLPFDFHVSNEFSEQFHTEFENIVPNYAKLYPYVSETLSAFITNGINIGIISNGKRQTQMKKLDSLGITSLFGDNIFISEEIRYEKPNKEIFHFVESELGCNGTPVYVGDSFEQDVLGALNAGWDAIYFQVNKQKKKLDDIPICSSFQELFEVVIQ